MSEQVSRISGRRQRPALRVVTAAAWMLAGIGTLGLSDVTDAAAVAALTLVTAAPLIRVGWLVFRWTQERDLRFAALGVGLLAVVAIGAILSLLTS